ncbi:MAG: ribonuclease III [Armatimonadota bacterium]
MQQEPDWEALRAAWGLDGVPVNLLRQAFSHPSYVDEHGLPACESNQRLEFLGDAVLGLIVGEYVYRAMPGASEGDLTSVKSLAVSRETLAEVAQRLDLGRYVLLGPQERASGGFAKPSILADCVEALLGAIYLAKGLEATRDFVLANLGSKLEELSQEGLLLDPKSELQQLLQATIQQLPVYVTVAEEGPPHDRLFRVEVRLRGKAIGAGTGTSKQRAQKEAARDALERKEEWLPEVSPGSEQGG